MPFFTSDRVRLFYRLEGSDAKPPLVLSNSIGTDHALWAPQMPDLLDHFRVLRYDTRGHGASDSPNGDYSIEMLARDVLDLTRAVGIEKFAFCGLSLGGMTGQSIAANSPDRVTALILANSSALMAPKSNWDTRRQSVLKGGMAAVADLAMGRFFSAETLASESPYPPSVRNTLLGTNPIGYAGCCAAIREMDQVGLLRKISAPTLVISGDRDVSTPWMGHGEILAREIPGAQAVHLPAAHLSNLEQPHSFTAAVLNFLLPPLPSGDDAMRAGEVVRRAILGNDHVDRSKASATDFTRDFQELITRYAWGTIWMRPGLDRRIRRMLVIAMTASLGRWEEFRMYVRASLARGLEPSDLKEVLLQTAIYAGVPAANTGFQIASEELEKLKSGRKPDIETK
jgi:3-oxoadipate enol-lactonase/4-carboxymuconolactone decarboxylase